MFRDVSKDRNESDRTVVVGEKRGNMKRGCQGIAYRN